MLRNANSLLMQMSTSILWQKPATPTFQICSWPLFKQMKPPNEHASSALVRSGALPSAGPVLGSTHITIGMRAIRRQSSTSCMPSLSNVWASAITAAVACNKDAMHTVVDRMSGSMSKWINEEMSLTVTPAMFRKQL